MALGYDGKLYILAFDHRGSFQTKMFGIEGDPTPEETETISDAKKLIYEGMELAVERGVEVVEHRARVLAGEDPVHGLEVGGVHRVRRGVGVVEGEDDDAVVTLLVADGRRGAVRGDGGNGLRCGHAVLIS